MSHLNTITERKRFEHLNLADRGKIQVLHEHGHSLRQIGEILGRHHSTISRELRRGTDNLEAEYCPQRGEQTYQNNRTICKRQLKLEQAESMVSEVEDLVLEKNWSPDAAVGYLKKEGRYDERQSVCTKTIYNYIDVGIIGIQPLDLPVKVKLKPSKDTNQNAKQHKRIYGTSIDERPDSINSRDEIGHWEVDTVLGSKQSGTEALLTIVERKVRFMIAIKIPQKDSASVNNALELLKAECGDDMFTSIFRSMTFDNGSEFSSVTEVLKDIPTSVYYAHPYSSWERGTNEKHNGMIRKYIPKGTRMETISETKLKMIVTTINTLPRKLLTYATPQELFCEEMGKILENAQLIPMSA